MVKTVALPFALFALATFVSGAIAVADSPAAKPPAATKPAASAAEATKPAAFAAGKPGGPATAAPAAPMMMPTPSKELEAFMKGFEGTWKCDTKFPAGSMGPGSLETTAKTSVKITKEFGGFSWHGEFKVPQTKTMPAMSGVFQIGYDPGTKQATFLSYDNMGAAMMGVGPLSGDSVTFAEEGYMMGMKAKVRETLTKKGPKEIRHSLEAEQGRAFQLMAEDTCKK